MLPDQNVPETSSSAAEVQGGFESFFRRTYPEVVRTCALLVGEFGLAEELSQEAFMRLFERWDDMESEEHARRFAFVTAVNLGRSHLRRSWRLRSLSVETLPPLVDVADASTTKVTLERTLRALSPRQRSVLVLVDYAGYSSIEAAEELGIRASTARVHLARAREAIRTALVDRNGGAMSGPEVVA